MIVIWIKSFWIYIRYHEWISLLSILTDHEAIFRGIFFAKNFKIIGFSNIVLFIYSLSTF